MVCHQCGKTVQRGDRFCTGCGTALHEADTPTGTESAPEATEPVAPDPVNAVTPVVSDPVAPDPVVPVAPDAAAPNPAASALVVSDPMAPDPALVAEEPTELLPSHGTRPPVPGVPPADPATPSSPAPPVADSSASDTDPSPERTELVPVVDGEIDGEERWGANSPVWAATGAVPAQPPAAPPGGEQPTGDLPATEPITEVWTDPAGAQPGPVDSQPDAVGAAGVAAVTGAAAATTATADAVGATDEATTPYDFVEQEVPTTTPAMTAEMPAYAPAAPAPHGFRLGAVTVISLLTGLVALVSLFANIVAVTSSVRLAPTDNTPFGFRTGSWIADDLADNLSIAGLLAIVLMIAGGVAAGFRWRWGAGLAAGAGLSMAGIAGLTLGLAQIPIDAAHEFAGIPNEQQFTLTITRDLGYWLMIVAAALGVVLFFAAINDASGDRRSGLNPWIAALGALAAVVAAAGPLIPENQAVFSDNWYIVDGPGEAPAMLLVGRLVQLGLLLFAGVVGFLTVRRWGLGLAIGGSLSIIWLAVSTLFELTDRPVGPGFRNPGALDMHVHGVTIIGVSAIAAMSVLAVIAAYDQAVRERH